MPKRIQVLILIATLFSVEICAQAIQPLERKSTINLDLKRSSKRSFALVLAANDVLGISALAEGTVNLKISDPSGQVLFQSVVKGDRVEWQKTITTEGSYSVEIESTAVLFKTRVSLSVSVLKPEFNFGDPAKGVLLNVRSKKTMIDGEFEINKKTPKSYTYTVKKGDTLIFSLKPEKGSVPIVEIKNDLNELVFGSFSSKSVQYVEIPIFADGTYTISLISSAFLAKTNFIKVDVISPARYEALPPGPPPAAVETPEVPEIQYDTIPEVYLDTVIYLGAKRDIINPDKRVLKFQFEDPSTVYKWFIIYGAGKGFSKNMTELDPLISGDALAAGATNALSAYAMGFLKKLPDPGSNLIKFNPSPSIRKELKPPIKKNYAGMDGGAGSHFLGMENTSQSFGQNVYIQVVVLRRIRLEN